MRRLIFWLITIAAMLGALLTYNANPIPRQYASIAPPDDWLHAPDAIAAGRALYRDHCAACHDERGDGNGTIKPAFGLKPANLTDRARAPEYLFWRISEGGRVEPYRSQGSIMPAWKYQLSEEQRWQLVAYVMTLAR